MYTNPTPPQYHAAIIAAVTRAEAVEQAATKGPWRLGWQHLKAEIKQRWFRTLYRVLVPETYVVIEQHDGFAMDDFSQDWIICQTHPYKHGADNGHFIAMARSIVPVALRGWRADAEYCIGKWRFLERAGYTDEDEESSDYHAARLLSIARLVVSALPPSMCGELTALGVTE